MSAVTVRANVHVGASLWCCAPAWLPSWDVFSPGLGQLSDHKQFL